MTKSPLGRCCIALDTKKKADQLMAACQKHKFDVRWVNGGEQPTEYKFWGTFRKNTAISLGWNKGGWNDEINEIDCGDKQYFKKYGGKFITFKKAMELLGGEKWIPKVDDKYWYVLVEKKGAEVCSAKWYEHTERYPGDYKTKKEATEKAKRINEILKN